MRLASKIFLATALVIAVLGAVGAWGLRQMGELVAVNREIGARVVPAVRLAGAGQDAMRAMVRLEARYLVLGDKRYAALWSEKAERARQDLARLEVFLRSPGEVAVWREAVAALDQYQAAVAQEHALMAQGRRDSAQQLADGESQRLVQRAEQSLEALVEMVHAAAVTAQSEAAELETRTWNWVLVALGAALVVGLASAALIATRLTRSLRVLSRATAAVATGAHTEPVVIQGRDEVAALAGAFNAMTARIREVDELKQGFLATVTHELRSPLTSMREAAHLLHEQVPGELNAKQARLVAIIGQSTERLLRLVNQILDLSRLRAGVVAMARERVDLGRIAARAVEELRPQADEAGVHLTLEPAEARAEVVGDSDRLIQVAVNLLSNAIRFTARDGRVTARVIAAGPEVELQVEDTGIGIPAAAVPHLFEWYGQAHSDRGGTGLGLAVVRSIVEAHGGRVTVESQEGKGSRFTVLLPRAGAER